MCRSRRELSNEYLLANIGVDTAENEPLEVWGENIQYYSLVSLEANERPLRKKLEAGVGELGGERFCEGLVVWGAQLAARSDAGRGGHAHERDSYYPVASSEHATGHCRRSIC